MDISSLLGKHDSDDSDERAKKLIRLVRITGSMPVYNVHALYNTYMRAYSHACLLTSSVVAENADNRIVVALTSCLENRNAMHKHF